MDSLLQEIIILMFSTLPLTALYVQGQSYFVPAIKAIGIQSAIISVLALVYFFLTHDIDFIVLCIILVITRVFLTPLVLLKVVKFREWDREKVKVLSAFILNLGFFLSTTLLLTYVVLDKILNPSLTLVIPFMLFFQGIFLMASRKSTTSHILGYIELENSLVVLGISLIPPPLLIDVTVFLDILGLVVISSVVIVEKKDHEPIEELVG